MAKGLPPKALALLDMDNAVSPPKTKKKPSKLDLGHLVPRTRLSRFLAPDSQVQKPFVLGPDLMTRSPSAISESPDRTPPLVQLQQRSDRSVGKRSAKDALLSLLPAVAENRPGSRSRDSPPQYVEELASRPVGRTAARSRSSVTLHNLYEHYEQRTFQDAMHGEHGASRLSGRFKQDRTHPGSRCGSRRLWLPGGRPVPLLSVLRFPSGRPPSIPTQQVTFQPPQPAAIQREAPPAAVPIRVPVTVPKPVLSPVNIRFDLLTAERASPADIRGPPRPRNAQIGA